MGTAHCDPALVMRCVHHLAAPLERLSWCLQVPLNAEGLNMHWVVFQAANAGSQPIQMELQVSTLHHHA